MEEPTLANAAVLPERGQMRRTSRRAAVLWDCAFQAGDLCARARFAWRATAKLSRHMLLHVGAML